MFTGFPPQEALTLFTDSTTHQASYTGTYAEWINSVRCRELHITP